jgi:predicted nucleic acid-binding protein
VAILDTNLLIDAMRKRPNETARRSIAAIAGLARSGERLMTTRMNVAELYVGAALSESPAEAFDRVVGAR